MQNKKVEKTQQLDADPALALHELIKISKGLIDFADIEMQALVLGDMLRFAYVQQDKEKLAFRYTKASEEFRNRIEEFRGVNPGLLDQLDKLQIELKQRTQSNNIMVDQIRKKASANTKETLFTAQQLGQNVLFNNQNLQHQGQTS